MTNGFWSGTPGLWSGTPGLWSGTPGLWGGLSAAPPPPASVTFTGTLPDAIIGQPYSASLTVSPPGSAITLDPAVSAALAARSISHDGFGNFTSASVT